MSKLNRTTRGLTFVFGTVVVFGIACGSILEANKDAVDGYLKTHSSTLVQKDGGKLFDTFTPDKEYLTEDGKGDSKKIVKAHEDLAKQIQAEGTQYHQLKRITINPLVFLSKCIIIIIIQ